MRTSVTWVNDYLDRPASAEEQATLLTAAGLNFDGGDTAENGEAWQEIETTSNRGDCLCHVGMAREICAMSGRTLVPPRAEGRGTGASAEGQIRVVNEDHEACPRYTARIVRGVTVRPSPEWMQRRLRAIGQIPRNALVDCTNFLLFELGQPAHVFDLDTLRGGEVRVRHARAGERLLPIGEGAAEVALRAGDLVIADAERPVAVAGVKGGAPTAVTERTRNVLIEAATFAPRAVRAASRGLRLASDSSHRFERGVAAADVDAAAERLVALILETAGGERAEGAVTAGAPLPAPREIELRPARVARVLGVEIPLEEILRALDTLGFAPRVRGPVVACTVPARRMDVEREIDLIEEICRIHGLDRIPVRDSIEIRVAAPQAPVAAARATKDLLVGLGFVETVTHTLLSERHATPFLQAGDRLLRVADERAGGAPYLRPSVLPSLLEVKRRNTDAGVPELRLFESARVFAAAGTPPEPRERAVLALLNDAPADEPFRWLRGACERLARLLAGEHARITFTPVASPASHFQVEARMAVQGGALGSIGVLAESALAPFGLAGTLAAAELELGMLEGGYPPDARAGLLPAFPAVDRDLSILVPESTPWARVEEIVLAADLPNFESLQFVGTYRGKQVGAERKSVTLRVVFRAPDRTLRREEADAAMATLAGALRSGLGAETRA
jgi:phenylalanyl-tRNA synthetase beta chain